jgi:hypothetical protein
MVETDCKQKQECTTKKMSVQEPVIEPVTHNGLSMETRVAELEKMVYEIWETIKSLIDRITGAENKIITLETENTLMKNELCKKDNTYAWCKPVKG